MHIRVDYTKYSLRYRWNVHGTFVLRNLQSWTSPHFWYFVTLFFVSCEGLLGKKIATVSAHQPGNFQKHIQQNIRNEGTLQIEIVARICSLRISPSRGRLTCSRPRRPASGRAGGRAGCCGTLIGCPRCSQSPSKRPATVEAAAAGRPCSRSSFYH